jgi:hypothetical protein
MFRTIANVTIIATLHLALGIQATSNSQPQTAVKEAWKSETKTSDEHAPDSNRLIRDSVFNDKTGQKKALDLPRATGEVLIGHSNNPPYYVRIPAIPSQQSDAVVVGKITDFQPYLSSDRTHLYTELTVTVERVMKDDAAAIGSKSTIAILEAGGNLTLANGKVVKDDFVPSNHRLEIGARYVLFLQHYPKGDYFRVVKNWELQGSHVVPIAHEDVSDAKRGTSPYQNMTESQFLQAVSDSLSTERKSK